MIVEVRREVIDTRTHRNDIATVPLVPFDVTVWRHDDATGEHGPIAYDMPAGFALGLYRVYRDGSPVRSGVNELLASVGTSRAEIEGGR